MSIKLISEHTGANVLTFNYRGVGKSTLGKDGKMPRAADLVTDCVDTVEVLLRAGVPRENIIIQGTALGGGVGISAAEKLPGVHHVNINSFSKLTSVADKLVNWFGKLASFGSWALGWGIDSHHKYQQVKKSSGHLLVLSSNVDSYIKTGARFHEGLKLETPPESTEVLKKPLRAKIDLNAPAQYTPEVRTIGKRRVTTLTAEMERTRNLPLIDLHITQANDKEKTRLVNYDVQAEYPIYLENVQKMLGLEQTLLPDDVQIAFEVKRGQGLELFRLPEAELIKVEDEMGKLIKGVWDYHGDVMLGDDGITPKKIYHNINQSAIYFFNGDLKFSHKDFLPGKNPKVTETYNSFVTELTKPVADKLLGINSPEAFALIYGELRTQLVKRGLLPESLKEVKNQIIYSIDKNENALCASMNIALHVKDAKTGKIVGFIPVALTTTIPLVNGIPNIDDVQVLPQIGAPTFQENTVG